MQYVHTTNIIIQPPPRFLCSFPQVDVRNEGDLCRDRGGGGCEVFLPSGTQTTGSLTPASTHTFNKVMDVDEGTETCATSSVLLPFLCECILFDI